MPYGPVWMRTPACSSLASALRRRLWNLAFRGSQKALGAFFLNPTDHIGRERLVSGSYYEAEYLNLLGQLLKPLGLGNGIALDVGANIGNHSCWLVRRFAHVIGVEPGRVAALVLEANLVSTCMDNWEIWNCALGARAGTGRLERVIEGNLGSSRIVADDSPSGEQSEVMTGDARMATRKRPDLPLQLIKVDVEGAELDVIEGLRNHIQEELPLICFEAWKEADFTHLTSCLVTMGYVRFHAPVPTIPARGSINRMRAALFGNHWALKPVAEDFPEDGYGMVFGFSRHHLEKLGW